MPGTGNAALAAMTARVAEIDEVFGRNRATSFLPVPIADVRPQTESLE